MMQGLHISNTINACRHILASAIFFCGIVSNSVIAQIAYQHADVTLRGQLIQGGMLIGQTNPSATIHLEGQRVTISDEGVFVIGFGRNAASNATLITRMNETTSNHLLKVKQRTYEVQRINNLDKDKVTPPPEAMDRISEDYRLARQARQHLTSMAHFADQFIWPVKGIITGVYGSGRILNNQPRSPHYGIDIAADTGTSVRMPASGKVVLIHDMYFSGLTMILDHGHGVFSTLLHLDTVQVKVGDYLKQGQVIATVGASGRVTGPHLDWRINWLNERLDPQLLVGDMQ